ncbi:MAG TPA: hypothetical protein VGF79_15020 [Bacteroidia bacterium]
MLSLNCERKINHSSQAANINFETTQSPVISIDSVQHSIHVMVALCDNLYQGIVKVPEGIGNGQKPGSNLYWGCGYGIKSYFKKSTEWQLISKRPFPNGLKKDSVIMERLVFKNKSKNIYLIADAYNGKYIEQCTKDLILSLQGKKKDTIMINHKTIGLYGNAKLDVYIGHNGLMDFNYSDSISNIDGIQRNCIILACASKNYFSEILKSSNAKPLLWTTNLMCPEAYTLHDALRGYVQNLSDKEIRNLAATAYSKYQKCSLKAALGLLVTGY